MNKIIYKLISWLVKKQIDKYALLISEEDIFYKDENIIVRADRYGVFNEYTN